MMKMVLRCTVVYVVTGKKSCYAIRRGVVGEFKNKKSRKKYFLIDKHINF